MDSATTPGNHIGARAQEAVISEACAVDARVALLEVVCVSLTIHVGRQMTVFRGAPSSAPRSVPQRPQVVHGEIRQSAWAVLDQFDLEELFLRRIPMPEEMSSFSEGKIAPLLGRTQMQRAERGNCLAWCL